MKDPMLDPEFLKKLDAFNNKVIYARIFALDFDENIVEQIEGKITGGSINVDGTSTVRRTCSLSLVAQEININDYYWGLKTKFRLFVGVENIIDPEYPDIIWFNQGVYVITSFSTSHSPNGLTISLQGKDKMVLLNGEMGGSIPSLTWDFGKQWEYDENNNLTIVSKRIVDIIPEVVREFAHEPLENIIVEDINEYGLELLEYRYDQPLYLLIDIDSTEVEQMVIGGQGSDIKSYHVYAGGVGEAISLEGIEQYDTRITLDFNADDPYVKDNPPTQICTVKDDGSVNHIYTVAKVTYGQTAGYRRCELTYPGDLIGNIGEPVTTACLDKILNMLQEFEYFYDIDGRFRFRRKATYLNNSWNNIRSLYDQTYVIPAMQTSPIQYNFNDGNLITAFSNTPDLANLRNDFSVWGTKKSLTGGEIPVHMRYAIDRQPTSYTTISVNEEEVALYNRRHGVEAGPQMSKTYIAGSGKMESAYAPVEDGVKYRFKAETYYYESDGEMVLISDKKIFDQKMADGEVQVLKSRSNVDWREIIYQMAKDYLAWNHLENFRAKLAERNEEYYTGVTGYETYYVDIEGFWRTLYNPDAGAAVYDNPSPGSRYQWNEADGVYEKVSLKQGENIVLKKPSDYGITAVFDEKGEKYTLTYTDESKKLYNYISSLGYVEATYLKGDDGNGNLTILFNRSKDYYIHKLGGRYDKIGLYEYVDKNRKYYKEQEFDLNTYWSYSIKNPETLLFWFDFLDTTGDSEKYSVHVLGDRPKGVNDNNVKAIYFRDTPLVVYVDADKWSKMGVENPEDYFVPADEVARDSAYAYVRLPVAIKQLFTISSQGKSANDMVESFLLNYAHCTESITLTTIPIYYLEPNVRIFVNDEGSHINGEYIVSRISIPLAYNGTMSISATKAVDSLYEQRR